MPLNLTTDSLVSLAVAQGATTPVPQHTPAGALCWSTTTNSIMFWNGTFWTSTAAAGADSPFFYKAGWWQTPNGTTAGNTIALNTVTAYPIVVPRPISISGISITITIAGTATTCLLGIYNSDVNNMPSTLVSTFGSLATTSVSNPTLTLGTPLALPPGVYWMAAVNQGTTAPTLTALTTGVTYQIPGSAAGSATGYTMTGVSGAFPSTFTIAGTSIATIRVPYKTV